MDTGNNDLVIPGALIDTKNAHIGKAAIVSMRTLESNAAQIHFTDQDPSAAEPVLLYIDSSFAPYGSAPYQHSLLVSVPVAMT